VRMNSWLQGAIGCVRWHRQYHMRHVREFLCVWVACCRSRAPSVNSSVLKPSTVALMGRAKSSHPHNERDRPMHLLFPSSPLLLPPAHATPRRAEPETAVLDAAARGRLSLQKCN
jgi:hypothetical protein